MSIASRRRRLFSRAASLMEAPGGSRTSQQPRKRAALSRSANMAFAGARSRHGHSTAVAQRSDRCRLRLMPRTGVESWPRPLAHRLDERAGRFRACARIDRDVPAQQEKAHPRWPQAEREPEHRMTTARRSHRAQQTPGRLECPIDSATVSIQLLTSLDRQVIGQRDRVTRGDGQASVACECLHRLRGAVRRPRSTRQRDDGWIRPTVHWPSGDRTTIRPDSRRIRFQSPLATTRRRTFSCVCSIRRYRVDGVWARCSGSPSSTSCPFSITKHAIEGARLADVVRDI